MSTESAVSVETDTTVGPDLFRALALGCVLVLTASYVSVLREVTRVVGGTQSLFLLVGAMLIAATVLARAIRPRTATVTAVAAGAVGFAYYLEASGVGIGVLTSATGELAGDAIMLVTGLELLRMVEAGIWTLGFAPGPVFLSWYLAVRGRYALSVLPGGFALVFLVLTGDAGTAVTLLGTVAALGAVGFGELERRGGTVAQADLLAVLFAAVIVLSLSVTFVPGDTATPATAGTGGGGGTLEGTIDSASERSGIAGQVDLSPEVRFTVESDEPSYWRTGVYDRYTGDEWIRSGQDRPVEDGLQPPPGEYETATQIVTAETELGVMPVAPQPLSVEDGAAQYATVSMHGQVRPMATLLEGDSYAVESAIVDPEPDELRAAGTDYPDEIEEYYLQTPESTSSEFEAYTADVTADADDPYEKAVAIEHYLRTSKTYSLDVDRPDGDVAEDFLLEMDAGYCVYFATAMTQMLRAEDVPARYVTGYTAGQQVDDGEYVVRGLDAHAWVEVYFPDHGWVTFEPTPADERDEEHDAQLVDARQSGADNVDVDESRNVPVTTDEETLREGSDRNESEIHSTEQNEAEPADAADAADESVNGSETGPDGELAENETSSAGGDDGTEAGTETGASADDGDTTTHAQRGDETDAESFTPPVTIPRDVAAIAAVVLVGLIAAVHRTDAIRRLRRTGFLYWHGRRGDPDRDAERAFRRLEQLLAREYRPRRRSESARAYLSTLATTAGANEDGTVLDGTESNTSNERALSVDDRTERVLECYERAIYGGGVSRAEADEAIELVDELARERLPVIG